MNIILSVGLKGSAAKLHRWFSRSRKKLIETFFFISCVLGCLRELGVGIKRLARFLGRSLWDLH